MLGLCVAVSIALFLYHPFFRVQKIAVDGTKRLASDDITATVNSSLNYRRWFIFPGAGYLMADVDDIRNVLLEKYPLANVSVIKTFPHSLSVYVQEKISTVIYDNGSLYSYLDPSGHVVELLQQVAPSEWHDIPATTSSTDTNATPPASIHRPAVANIQREIGDYPIVYDTRRQKVEQQAQVLPEKIVRGIIAWFDFFEKQSNVPFGYIEITDDRGNGVIHTGEGWEARMNLIENIGGQTELLQHLLNEQTNRKQISYIDLRYQGRVYWK